jgi:hypothetical protein
MIVNGLLLIGAIGGMALVLVQAMIPKERTGFLGFRSELEQMNDPASIKAKMLQAHDLLVAEQQQTLGLRQLALGSGLWFAVGAAINIILLLRSREKAEEALRPANTHPV